MKETRLKTVPERSETGMIFFEKGLMLCITYEPRYFCFDSISLLMYKINLT